MNLKAQELNKTIQDPVKAKPVLLNICTRDGLMRIEEFKTMYDGVYDNYKPDSLTLIKLKKLTKHTNIIIVMGTWCGDSKLQVPHFYKVLDGIGFDTNKSTKIICVDGNKKAENGLIDHLDIQHIPTFIIFNKKGKELGRIIESPKITLEKDLLAILEKKS